MTTIADQQKVWVLEYSHKHGNDLSAYASEELAEAGIFAIMREFMSDFEQTASSGEDSDKLVDALSDALERRDLAKASQLWSEVTQEGFEITELSVAAQSGVFGHREMWAVVRAPTGDAVAMFRDEGTADDWVDCHYKLGKSKVESVVVPEKLEEQG